MISKAFSLRHLCHFATLYLLIGLVTACTSGSEGSSPAGRAGADADAGGNTGIFCVPNEFVCDGNRATTCNAEGTGFEVGGLKCSSKQTCVAGACESQTLCVSDQRVRSHVCVPCAAGSTNAAGDNATAEDTSCEPTLCDSDQRVQSHQCVACPAGSTNAAGDDASGANTSCDATLCPSNQSVQSHVCVACPAGSTNAAGDDASGANTSCDATLCPSNQSVQSHVCVDCPADSTNTAGDDASGANTSCETKSCSGLAATCGAAGNADCCASGLVTGGTFNRSNDAAYPATVSNFRLDNYEITVGRFRKFVAAYSQAMTASGAGKNPNDGSDTGWDTAWNASLPADAAALTTALKCSATYQSWTDAAGAAAAESLPINCITWFEAEAFCIWDGGRLPTEAEWNYAAAGGAAQRNYPWGATAPDCSYANFLHTDYCTSPGTGGVNGVGSESPKGDGLYGQSDLAGNVWEWTQDWYVDPYPATCDNCANLTASSNRVNRGGSFHLNASLLLSSGHYGRPPSNRYNYLGARCARNP